MQMTVVEWDFIFKSTWLTFSTTDAYGATMTRLQSRALSLIALLVASFLINVETTAVNVALPAMVRELGSTTTQLQWIVDAYSLAFASLLLTAGSLSDRFGRKGMLLSGLAVFAAGSVVGGFMTASGSLIAARAVMGLGAAMTFPSTLSLIRNIFTDRLERSRAIGLWGATAGIAIAVGPIVGGWLLERYSWSSIFYAMGPVALAGIVLVALAVPTSRDPEARTVDVLGLVLSTAAMSLVIYTIIEAPNQGWSSGRTIGGLVGTSLLGLAFVLWEGRLEHPMLDVRLFRTMRFTAASVSVTVAFFTLFGFIFLMTQYFQFIRGYGPLETGLRLLPVALSVGAGSVLGTQLAVRVGTKVVVTAGLVLIAAFYLWVALSVSISVGYGVIAGQMVVYGLGLGLTSAPATESIMGAVSARQAGIGSAVNDATRLLGGTLGVAIIGSVASSVYASRLTDSLPQGLPHQVTTTASQSVGAALEASQRLAAAGHGQLASLLQTISSDAYVHSVSVGCYVAGGVAALGALLAAAFLPAQPLMLEGALPDLDHDDAVPAIA
jgi:EmrB/QacA subfamily drug resistance transporter